MLIRVEPDLGGAGAGLAKGQADGMIIADFRSVDELLSASKKPQPQPADDIRSEFDLIVVHATSLALQPEAAALAAHADLVMLVAREDAVELGRNAQGDRCALPVCRRADGHRRQSCAGRPVGVASRRSVGAGWLTPPATDCRAEPCHCLG